jgi:hypothetical protein
MVLASSFGDSSLDLCSCSFRGVRHVTLVATKLDIKAVLLHSIVCGLLHTSSYHCHWQHVGSLCAIHRKQTSIQLSFLYLCDVYPCKVYKTVLE